MKSEDEVRKALAHSEAAMKDSVAAGDMRIGLIASVAADILLWVLDEGSDFGKLIDKLDARERRTVG